MNAITVDIHTYNTHVDLDVTDAVGGTVTLCSFSKEDLGLLPIIHNMVSSICHFLTILGDLPLFINLVQGLASLQLNSKLDYKKLIFTNPNTEHVSYILEKDTDNMLAIFSDGYIETAFPPTVFKELNSYLLGVLPTWDQ